jgi:tetratricopeptide (TPR) repeat protein
MREVSEVSATPTPSSGEGPRAAFRHTARVLGYVLLALIAFRIVYHARYLLLSPFAQVTLSDGQVYEDAARDLLAHPPWGTQPFFLQGLYAYVLALGMAFVPVPLAGLCVQLALCALGSWAAYRSMLPLFGVAAARAAMAVLLAYPALWFYENKYLSAGVGMAANAAVILAFVRTQRWGRARDALLLGLALALSVLGRPNMVLALPFAALALAMRGTAPAASAGGSTSEPRRSTPALLSALALGLALGVAPMAVRNAIVVGEARIFPSHGGGIPFFIGNNPQSQGLWNGGGGLITGQVGFERLELQHKLGLSGLSGGALDRAIGDALYARALAHLRDDPGHALERALKKLALCLGNAEHAHDFDRLGEAQQLGPQFSWGLPFGALLALGSLGLWLLFRDGGPRRALSLLLLGQAAAVVTANVVYFHASQHRLPLALPLAFASGALFARLLSPGGAAALRGQHGVACAFALLLGAQAFVAREPSPPRAVTAAHHANLAAAWEALGDDARALSAYQAAVAKSPKRAILRFRLGLLLARLGRTAEAIAAFERARSLAKGDALIRDASARELTKLRARPPAPDQARPL